jgi:hypothetical protein
MRLTVGFYHEFPTTFHFLLSRILLKTHSKPHISRSRARIREVSSGDEGPIYSLADLL